MKKLLTIISIITIAAILSSCGMYKEPCEGVGSIEVSSEKKI